MKVIDDQTVSHRLQQPGVGRAIPRRVFIACRHHEDTGSANEESDDMRTKSAGYSMSDLRQIHCLPYDIEEALLNIPGRRKSSNPSMLMLQIDLVSSYSLQPRPK